MASRPRSLTAFLAAARSALAAPAGQRPTPLTFVVGNESADLDSLCCAVLLAYFRSHTPPNNTLHVPLSNLPRADLALRPELQAALSGGAPGSKDAIVPLSDLITLSDIPDDLKAADTRWLLVDHNALTGDLATRFAPSVVGCIDHHVDEGVIPEPATAVTSGEALPPRIIERCGSCASLVIDHCRDVWRDLAAAQPDTATDRILARLALAPILIDTSNLKSASKTEDVDKRSAAFAESFLSSGSGEGEMAAAAANCGASPADATSAYSRSSYFDQLSHLKNDITAFSYNDLLRKDYKQWHEKNTNGHNLALGMSTVVQGVDYLLAHTGDQADLLSSTQKFVKERDLDLIAMMTVQHDGNGFGRQLLLWAFNNEAVVAAKEFAKANQERLGLETWKDGQLDDTTGPSEWRACWRQTRTEFSRKQVAPFLREAMKSS